MVMENMKPRILKEINGLFWIQVILLLGTFLITLWMAINARNYSTHFSLQKRLSADIYNQQIAVASETGRPKEDAIKLANMMNSEIERGNALLAQTWRSEYRVTLFIGLGFAIMLIVQMRILKRCGSQLLEEKQEQQL